jgi:hypothetical protein
MAKKVEKNTVVQKKENTVPVMEIPVSPFANLKSGELLARIKTNVAERKRLAKENKELFGLYKATKGQEKTSSTEAKIKALTAQLEALKNPKVK